MSRLFFYPKAIPVDSTGTPYALAEANFYLTTTTTRTDTYTTSALSVANDNPVVADAAGKFPVIYLDPTITYRCIVTETGAGAQIDDVDPILVPLDAGDFAITDAGGYFTATTVEGALQEIGSDYGPLAGANTWTGDQTYSGADIKMADNIVERAEIKDYSLTHNAITSTSNAITADCSTGNSFYHLLTENTTFTLSNPSPTGKLCSIVIRIKQDTGGGAYTVAWPGTVTWGGGTAPVMSTGNDAVDKFVLSTDDAGTTWFGEFAQAYAAA